MFREWFHIEFHSIVEGLERTPIEDENAAWDPGLVEGIKRGERAIAEGRVGPHAETQRRLGK